MDNELYSRGGKPPEGCCGYVTEGDTKCLQPAIYDIFYADPLGQQHYGLACLEHGAMVRGDSGLISIQSREDS